MTPDRPILSLYELEAFDPHAPQGARRRFCCPLCGQGKPKDSAHRCLSVESVSGLWKCFRCEASGRLREQWEEKPLQRRARARRQMQSAFGLEESASSMQSRVVLEMALAQVVSAQEPLPKPARSWRASLEGLVPLEGTRGQSYLEKRGLTLEVCRAAKVKFAPSWLGRPAVVFPLYDEGGTLVAAQGRYVDGRSDPKARTLGNKKNGVFVTGDVWEQTRKGAPLLITEAPIDALSLALCGFPSIALCGKSGAPAWLPLRCAFKEIVLAFDADEAGEQGSAALLPMLSSLGAKVCRLAPEGAKDWNEMVLAFGQVRLDEWLCFYLLKGTGNQ